MFLTAFNLQATQHAYTNMSRKYQNMYKVVANKLIF